MPLLRAAVLVLAAAAAYQSRRRSLPPEIPAPADVAAPQALPPEPARRPARKKREPKKKAAPQKKPEPAPAAKRFRLRKKTAAAPRAVPAEAETVDPAEVEAVREYDGPVKLKKKDGEKPTFQAPNTRDAERVTRERLTRMRFVLLRYEGANGRFRSGVNGVREFVLKGAARPEEVTDGWGREFAIKETFGTGEVSFYSKGPDGAANTPDDIR